MSDAANSSNWTESLVQFLRSEPGLEAVRVDPEARKVSVATLGEVDEQALSERLQAILQRIEDKLPVAEGSVPEAAGGFTVQRTGAQTEVAGPTCETSPKFWRWREFAWPEPESAVAEDTHDHEDHDWRFLATLAGLCGVFGLSSWWLGRMDEELTTLSLLLASSALIAGGWDAAVDSWENIKRRKLDIHFLMLAVAVGAVSIGAWYEAIFLLFLFSASGAMEAFALDRTHRAVDSLLQSAPKHALRLNEQGEEVEVAVA
ncbi:cation-transporting P-type ATPase, partial [Opitutaceae bacterium]|nr:cation-transporting P-type ATPase [Opitutaceae bacterium]